MKGFKTNASATWDAFIDPNVRFETIGDSISGTLVALEAREFDDGGRAPHLTLMTPEGERYLTASSRDLVRKLVALAPSLDSTIEITLLGIEDIPGTDLQRKTFNVRLIDPSETSGQLEDDGTNFLT